MDQFLSPDEVDTTWDRTSTPANASSGWKGLACISHHSSGPAQDPMRPIFAAFVQVSNISESFMVLNLFSCHHGHHEPSFCQYRDGGIVTAAAALNCDSEDSSRYMNIYN